MLTEITLENFKAFKKLQHIPIKPITLVFGPNSAGKSSIVHALAYLKHHILHSSFSEANVVNLGWSEVTLGGVKNLVHGHSTITPITISAKADKFLVRFIFLPQFRFGAASDIEFELNGSLLAKAEANRDNHLYPNNTWLVKIDPSNPASKEVREFFKKRILIDAVLSSPADDTYTDYEFESWEDEILEPCDVNDVLEQFDEVFESFLRNGIWRVLGPSDPFAEETKFECYLRECTDPNSDGHSFTTRGCDQFSEFEIIQALREKTKHGGIQKRDLLEIAESLAGEIWSKFRSSGLNSQPLYATLKTHRHLDPVRDRPPGVISMSALPEFPKWEPWRELLRDASLRKLVNETLQNIGIIHELVLRKRCTIVYHPEKTSNSSTKPHTSDFESIEPELAFYDRRSQVTVSQHDLGYGISTIVPVVSSILGSKKSLISIEQPELHVHPGLQTALGDAFIISTIERNNTLLIETHSEHLILRILRRIRETTEGEIDDWPDALRKACPNGIRPDDVGVLYVEPSENGSIVTNLRINELGEFIDEWPNGFFDERIREVF